MDDMIRQYSETGNALDGPLAVVVIGFETDFRTRKENGVERQEPADKVILGKFGDPQYRQEEWISRLSGPRCDSPRIWHELVKPAYEAWKRGEEMVHQGTPLSILGFISPRTIQAYRLANVHTVEQLAMISDTDLPRLGLSGRNHRDLAAKHMETANSETTKLAARQREQDDQIATQAAQIAELQAMLQKQQGGNKQAKAAA